MERHAPRLTITIAALAAATAMVAGCARYQDDAKDGAEPSNPQRTAREVPRSFAGPPPRRRGQPSAEETSRAAPSPADEPELKARPVPSAMPSKSPERPAEPADRQPSTTPTTVPVRPTVPVAPVQPVTPRTPVLPQPPVVTPTTPTQPGLPGGSIPAQPQGTAPGPTQGQPVAPARPVVPADPLPTEPGPAPQRPDPIPAPPNRVNVTPPQQSGGGIVAALPGARDARSPEGMPSPGGETAITAKAAPGLSDAVTGASRIEEARRLFARGMVVAARSVLESALASTPAQALQELGRTYDPFYLGQMAKIDDGSQPTRAAALYLEAILHGSTTAGNDLDRLRRTLPSLR